jgi:hypothetical protein
MSVFPRKGSPYYHDDRNLPIFDLGDACMAATLRVSVLFLIA